jgi:DNA-binding transcriptional ArsR family regulator
MRRIVESRLDELVAVTRALGDETRLRLLAACTGGERCACQLVELSGLAPSTVSKHLQLLRQAGLLMARKEGRWVHYRIPRRSERTPPVEDALRLVQAAVKREPYLIEDAARLERILEVEPESLCRQQRAGSA